MDAKKALLSRNNVLPGLRENETVLTQTVISNAIYWKGIAVLILAIILLFVAYQLAIFISIVAFIILAFAYIRKHFYLLVVTNQRILVRSGVLLADMIQLQFTRIESVETQTTLIGQLFGYTTLMVSGTGSRLAFLPFVENAHSVQSIINELLQEHDLSSREHMQEQAIIQAQAIADALSENQVNPEAK